MKGSVIYGGSFLAGVFGYIAPTLQSAAMITIYDRHISFLVLSLDPFNGFIEAVYGPKSSYFWNTTVSST